MKYGRIESHFIAKHKDLANCDISYFEDLKTKFENRTTIPSIFTSRNSVCSRVQEVSYISLLIAKTGKDHTIGEKLGKPSIAAFLKTVMGKGDEIKHNLPQ
jgi:hypothetical protein